MTMQRADVDVDYKVALLQYLIDTKQWLHDPYVERFWDFIGESFSTKAAPLGSPKLTGKELEALCKDEVDLWGDEKEKERRKGYEKGSEYDVLMKEWVDIWDDMMIAYWKMEVDQPGPNFHKYDIIPEIWRAEVEKLLLEPSNPPSSPLPPSTNQAKKISRSIPRPPNNTTEAPANTTQELQFQYSIPMLRSVVESAKERAIEVGKGSLAGAVQQIFDDSLRNPNLRLLLEKTLAHRADEKEHDQFLEYVRRAKQKLKGAKKSLSPKNLSKQETPSQTPQQANTTDPAQYKRKANESKMDKGAGAKKPGPVHRKKPRFPNISKKPSNFKDDDSSNAADRVDSAQVSEQRSDKEAAMNSRAVTSIGRNAPRKRDLDPEISSDAAEEADLAEAQRAAKRRKYTEDDDSGTYRPRRSAEGLRQRTAKKLRQTGNSIASSPLSSHGDTDVEAAREAYVDELMRRQSAHESRQAIEAEYGPVSPTIAGDARSEAGEDWASMPSPELEKSNTTPQAIAGAEKRAQEEASASTAPAKIPSPPPAPEKTGTASGADAEELTEDDSSHAYRIITGAAAEAVAPAISRLEEKIDALISSQKANTQQPTPPPQQLLSPISQQAIELSASSSQELTKLAAALQSSELNAQNPELAKMVTQLAQKAAEAAVHAAEAAKKAAEMVRDVSVVLVQFGTQKDATEQGKQ